jgi:hypothetical protein
MRNIGMAVGVAVSGAMFSYYKNSNMNKLSALGQSGKLLETNSFTHALHYTFLVAAIVSLLAMVASFTKGKVK